MKTTKIIIKAPGIKLKTSSAEIAINVLEVISSSFSGKHIAALLAATNPFTGRDNDCCGKHPKSVDGIFKKPEEKKDSGSITTWDSSRRQWAGGSDNVSSTFGDEIKVRVETPEEPTKRSYTKKTNSTGAYKERMKKFTESTGEGRRSNHSGKTTWSEENDMTILNSMKAGLTATEISKNPTLLANHTDKAIITRVSGIKNNDVKRVGSSVLKRAQEILY